MSRKFLCVLAGMLAIAGCFGQASCADQYVKRLTEHWRWKQYWEGTTELGGMYSPGRQFQALVFWRTDKKPPSVGFCSTDLGVCQFYPNAPGNEHSFEEKISSGNDTQSAFRHFLADSFGDNSLIGRPPAASGGEYTTEKVTITLPALDPPEAFRDPTPQPGAETDALVANLSCPSSKPRC